MLQALLMLAIEDNAVKKLYLRACKKQTDKL